MLKCLNKTKINQRVIILVVKRREKGIEKGTERKKVVVNKEIMEIIINRISKDNNNKENDSN